MKLPDKHTRLPQKDRSAPNKFRNTRLNKLVGYKKILKGIFVRQKSYRSEPDIMADNFKSLYFDI